jgi:hypothetical protein
LLKCHYAISTPLIWIDTAVVEANPLIILVAARACFNPMLIIEFAGIETAGISVTLSSATVTVDAVVAALDKLMSVTIAVVPEGTVYSVALDVAAAVLAIAFDVVAISYYSFLVGIHN